jgi:hypothetical protein
MSGRRLLAAVVACVGLAASPAPADAATFTVTSDQATLPGESCAPLSTTCTLPRAVLEANALPDTDDIVFAIATGPQTITLTSTLEITSPVRIDGRTQPGYDPLTGFAVIQLALDLGPTPTDPLVRFGAGAGGSITGLGLIGRVSPGIEVASGSGPVTVTGNFVGAERNGSGLGGTIEPSIEIAGDGSTVGGLLTSDRNVLPRGVVIADDAQDTTVRGNVIGLNLIGDGVLGDGVSDGVFVGCRADGTTVAGNVISGMGIGVNSAPSCTPAAGGIGELTIAGNLIGLNAAGTEARTNALTGINLYSVRNVAITGNAIGSGTNAVYKLAIDDGNGGTIRDNRIGTRADGTGLFTNDLPAVYLSDSLNLTLEGNTIAGARVLAGFPDLPGAGVTVVRSTGIRITRNVFRDNEGLGIDLGTGPFPGTSWGPTPNDPGDADGAGGVDGNRFQNFPTIESATTDGGATTIRLTLDSTPNSTFEVELFSTPACDASGYGEAETYLATRTLRTDAAGNAEDSLDLPPLPLGTVLTATATDDATNDTSELSACRVVATPTPTPTPTATPDASNPEPTVTPGPTPTPTATPVPTPVVGRSIVVGSQSGVVKVKPPGGKAFVTLGAGRNIPVGSSVDTTKGTVRLTVSDGRGGLRTGEFHGGRFLVQQPRRGSPTATLVLNEPLAPCSKRAKAAGQSKTKKPKKKSRYVWGKSTDKFEVQGRYGVTGNTGTIWLTRDTCDGTDAYVRSGHVRVVDLRTGKRVATLAKGDRYLVPAKRR